MVRRTREQWRKLMEELETAGLTHAELADRCGVRVSTLRSWLYRFRRERSPQSMVFAEVVAEVTTPTRSAACCVVKLAGGLELELSSLPEPRWLAELCRATAES